MQTLLEKPPLQDPPEETVVSERGGVVIVRIQSCVIMGAWIQQPLGHPITAQDIWVGFLTPLSPLCLHWDCSKLLHSAPVNVIS